MFFFLRQREKLLSQMIVTGTSLPCLTSVRDGLLQPDIYCPCPYPITYYLEYNRQWCRAITIARTIHTILVNEALHYHYSNLHFR